MKIPCLASLTRRPASASRDWLLLSSSDATSVIEATAAWRRFKIEGLLQGTISQNDPRFRWVATRLGDWLCSDHCFAQLASLSSLHRLDRQRDEPAWPQQSNGGAKRKLESIPHHKGTGSARIECKLVARDGRHTLIARRPRPPEEELSFSQVGLFSAIAVPEPHDRERPRRLNV